MGDVCGKHYGKTLGQAGTENQRLRVGSWSGFLYWEGAVYSLQVDNFFYVSKKFINYPLLGIYYFM
jgi:hypothetical protein